MAKQHEAKLVEPAAFHHFETTTNEGGIGIDFQYGVMADESRTLQAIQFDGEAITAEAAYAWLAKRNVKPIGFTTEDNAIEGEWVPSAQDAGWDADSASRRADDCTRDANMPADHHQETKHATAAASHRNAAAAHEKAAALHDSKAREATAAGDDVTAASSKQSAEKARTEQARHETEAKAHDKKLKELRKSKDGDGDDDKTADDDADGDGKKVKATQIAASTLEAADHGYTEVFEQVAKHFGKPVEEVRAAIVEAIGDQAPGPDDIQAINNNHEPGTGRFAHGSGGTRKLQDAGANAASEMAHAASKSAAAFTGSHAAAASAHMEAAAAAKRVQQRSQVEFENALARKDSLGAVAHSTEATNAEQNHAQHLRMALAHEERGKAEAEHAIRTGLAAALPKPEEKKAEAAPKKGSLVGRAVMSLGRGTGNVVKYGGAAVGVASLATTPLTGGFGLAGAAAGAGTAAVGHIINRAFGGGKKPEGGGEKKEPGAISQAMSDVESHAAGEIANRLKQGITGKLDKMAADRKIPVATVVPTPPIRTNTQSSPSRPAGDFGSRMTSAGDAAHGGAASVASNQPPVRHGESSTRSTFGDTLSAIERARTSSRSANDTEYQFQAKVRDYNHAAANARNAMLPALPPPQPPTVVSVTPFTPDPRKGKIRTTPSWMTPEARAEHDVDKVTAAIMASLR